MARKVYTLEVLKKGKYGRLTVIDEAKPYYNCRFTPIRRVICRCDCNNITEVILSNLLSGRIQSCGCLAKERRRDKVSQISDSLKIHGMWGTPLYRLWAGMKSRCYNKNHISYKYYGAKNIIVCKDWLIFENFMKWANSNSYGVSLSIDRINSKGNYEPNNCRFIPLTDNIKRRFDNTNFVS